MGTSADYVTDMFTDRQMVGEGGTKHFDGSYSALVTGAATTKPPLPVI